ncbi:MAG: hypothetical protein R3Y26_00155 [Rikenellaceae bacterium]
MKKLIYLFSSFLLLTACGQGSVNVDYGNVNPSTIKLAVNDLEECVNATLASSSISPKFSVSVDSKMENGSFGYKISENNEVSFFAGDEIGVTHAIYTLLEELGYTFDITGISKPEQPNLTAFTPKDTLITPSVRWRGIRQHVNFPMDISSYEIEDAKKYLDDLLRMRFNKLTIHTYPGQWYETMIGDSLSLAGNYFYGNNHFLYESPLLQKAIPANDSVFCIPSAEKLSPEENSKFAINWMQQLIRYAKELGFYVQVSFEPRISSIDQAVSTSMDVYNLYPEIDALELITEETGGWGPRCTEEEVKASLAHYFTPEIASDEIVNRPIQPKQSDLNAIYSQMGVICKAIEKLEPTIGDKVELKIGIYCSVGNYTESVYRLARLAMPDNKVCLMPSHGSMGTANSLPNVIRTKEDLAATEIYSWVEFDGLMYLYQNSILGNNTLMDKLDEIDPNGQHLSILYNHWRTAECRTSARYATEVTMTKDLTPDQFYLSYAERLGVKTPANLKKALDLITEADIFASKNLGNIGFCWMGAWRTGGFFNRTKKDRLIHTRELYYEAGKVFSELIKEVSKDSEAYSYLAFIENRVLCTVIYLDAFIEGVGIQTIEIEKDGSVSESEQLRARAICDKSLLIFDQYLEVLSQMMPDRGCEGTLASSWSAPIRGLKIYREKLGGVPMSAVPGADAEVDAPPLPIFYEEE